MEDEENKAPVSNRHSDEHWDDEDYDDEYSDSIDEDEDDFDEHMSNCGRVPGGGCMLAGTEYCDWDCPFSAAMYRNASRKRDSKGRYCK